MYNILIYGLGVAYDKYLNAVKYQEVIGRVKIAAVTRSNYTYSYVDGYPFVPSNEIDKRDYDVCVIAAEAGSATYAEVQNICVGLGFDKNNIVPISAFAIPCFDLEKYLKIQKISIFALNCWGGGYISLFKSAFSIPIYKYV